jgi:tetratricopeptide (TPR) repeat protein
VEEAETLWTKLVAAEQDEHRVFRSLDRMIQLDKNETALAILEKLLRDDPDNWEALYRKGFALWRLDKKEESLAAFEKLNDLNLDDDELSSAAKHLQQQRKQRTASSNSSAYLQSRQYPPVIMRSQAFYYMQQMLNSSGSRGQTRWSPDDYGQARVAALSVRYLHAQAEGKQDDYLTKLKADIDTQAEKNPQKLWDLFYLQYANRQQPETRYKEQYELGKRISKALDSDEARYAYLGSLRLRNYRGNGNLAEAQENAEPLSDEEITHMLNCFEQVYSSHPEWLSYAGGVQTVSTELRLAGKEDSADELYQRLVQEARDEKSLGTAMQVAATAGSIDDVLELARRGEEQFSSSGQMNQYQSYRFQAFHSLLQKLIAEDRFDDIERLLIAQFEHQKRRFLSLPVYRRSRAQQSNNPIRVGLSSGSSRRTETINYPNPNPFFDTQDIIFAYTAFDGFRQHQKTGDLVDALAAKAAADTDLDEVVSRLALAYVRWWSQDQTAARKEIETIAKLYPNEPFLQLQLIDAYYRSKQYRDALKIVNELRATDRKLLEQREIIALKLAVQVGELERAREAAKRLFGMNLKTDLQIQLASQMNQLGMHELADAVLARTRRRAGNRGSTLVQLMQQYASKGNNDVANQIAMQIIRRTSPASVTSNSPQRRADASYRKSAIQQLNKTGELNKLIARLEEQLKSSPDSKRLNETLLDYYQSAGRTKEADDIMKKLRANLPDNPSLLVTQARKLYSSRDYKGACDLYLKVIELKPELLGNEYYNIQRSFDQAKRHDDLIKLFLSVDMSKLQNDYYRVTEMVNWIARLDDGKRVDDAVKIFQRAWEALPQYRQYMLSNLYATQLWSNDVIYNYSREILIPAENATLSDPWKGLSGGSHSVSSNGTITGILSRSIDGIAKNEDRRKQFMEEVAAARKVHPKWHAGTVYVALFDAKDGETSKAHSTIKAIFDDKSNHPSSSDVSWMIASELSRIDGMEQTALDLLQSVDLESLSSRYSSSSMNYDPRRLMVTLYQKTGEPKKAHDLLFALFEDRDYSRYNSSNPGYAEYHKLRDLNTVSDLLIEMNYVVDAIRLLEETLANDALFAAASRYGGSSYKRRLESNLKNARKKLTPELLRKSLADWLPDPKAEEYTGTDLMLSVQPETIESATLKCLFEESLLSLYGNTLPQIQVSGQPQPVKKEPLTTDDLAQNGTPDRTSKDSEGQSGRGEAAETVAALQERLGELESRWPKVLTFPAIEVLLLLPDQSAKDQQAKALEALLEAIETHGNSLGEQESAGEQVVAVWLVARKALQSPEHQAIGETLADFVIDSSATIDEPTWVAAILRERGQIALDAGDRKAAEGYWSLLLAHILKTETQLGKKTTSTRAGRIRSGTVAIPVPAGP